MNVAGIILAAGKGTRMKSELPKCSFPVCGIPMVELVGRAMKTAGVERPIVVVGHVGERIVELLGDGYEYVWQHEQLGTGHAVLQCAEQLRGFDGPVLISAGDTPLIEASTFRELLAATATACATATIASAVLDDPFGYGRIVRDDKAAVTGIVEQKDASDSQKEIREVNAAIYCVDCSTLFRILPTIRNENSQGEYYLTDIFGAMAREGLPVSARIFSDRQMLTGVNDRWQLAEAGKELNRRIVRAHALAGVSFVDPGSTFIGPDVCISPDAVIRPFTIIEGASSVGARTVVGPGSRVVASRIGSDSTVLMSNVDSAKIGDHVWVGPFAHLRPGTVLENGVKIGNYVEVKNAHLSTGTKANHLSYIGDAQVGPETNIGAGTITCNYDGFCKHTTVIGASVFVGSNSTLIAPVSIGDGAMIAAGSTISQDIPAGAGAFGRARQENKPDWATRWREKKRSERSKP